jgi:probable phosphoglycerate mutase
VADQHRGETVLVVGHQTALGIVVPTLARGLSPTWARDHELDNTGTVELEHDSAGWVLTRWGATVSPDVR